MSNAVVIIILNKMKKIFIILATAMVFASCVDANRQYVRKAVRIMDKEGILATDSRWWE